MDNLKQTWKKLRDNYYQFQDSSTVTAEPAFQDLLDKVWASYEDKNPPKKLDLEVELLRFMLIKDIHPFGKSQEHSVMFYPILCRFWMYKADVEFILKLYQAFTNYAIVGTYTYTDCNLQIVATTSDDYMRQPYSLSTEVFGATKFLNAFRTVLFEIDEATFLQGKAVAEQIRNQHLARGEDGFQEANLIAFTFARNPQWAEDDIRTHLYRRKNKLSIYSSYGEKLVASITDADLAIAFIEDWGRVFAYELEDYVYDIVEGMGERAKEVLEAALKYERYFHNKRPVRRIKAGIKLSQKVV